MTYIRVWLMMIYREGQEFARNRAGWVMPLLPPLLARVVVRPSPIGPASLWNSANWVWFAAVMPGVMLAAASLAEERERGTWTALRLAPIPLGSVIVVKIGVVGIVAMASEVLLWALIPHPTAPWPLTAMVWGGRIRSVHRYHTGPGSGFSTCNQRLICGSDGGAVCECSRLSRPTAYDFMAFLGTKCCVGPSL